MSLTNEQRAHDLAVASLPFMKELIAAKLTNDPSTDIKFDAYLEYKKLYDAFLDACNEDFKA